MTFHTEENRGIYIHVPFCRRKCLYCDFYSVGEKVSSMTDFADAVENEFSACSLDADDLVTLYIGGGTPSLLDPAIIARFRKMIPNNVGEFTIEVNPDDVTEDKARQWKEAGVNRISMGVQSLIDSELNFIGRRHSSDDAIRAFGILRKLFDNISIDIMFGLPAQTFLTLKETLEGIIKLNPEHISAYSLMYEERTALTRLRDCGKLKETADVDSEKMFHLISETLKEAGYVRYEISNYSRPGYYSRHNSNYWVGKPYLGLGPGAHSYDGFRKRYSNLPDIRRYIDKWKKPTRNDDINKLRVLESLTDTELREEMIMTRLRTATGISLDQYEERFGEEQKSALLKNARNYIDKGLLCEKEGFLYLTKDGVMVSDDIMVGLF